MRNLLRNIIQNNGGSRAFPKSANGMMLSLLADMEAKGELRKVGETETELIYGLPVELGAVDAMGEEKNPPGDTS